MGRQEDGKLEKNSASRVVSQGLCVLVLVSLLGVFAVPAAAVLDSEWEVETSLGEARHLAVVVSDDEGLVYVISGVTTGLSYPTVHANTYDPYTGDWTELEPIPVGVRGSSGVFGEDGRLYIMSGYNDTFGHVSNVQIYDPEADEWSAGAAIPNAVWAGRSALGSDGRIYVLGGETSSTPVTNLVQIYDPEADSWSSGAGMPAAMYHGVAIPKGSYIYYLSGADSTFTGVPAFYRYYVPGNSWSTLSSMPMASWGGGGALGPDGFLYYFGGYASSGITGNGCYYDLTEGVWKTLPDLNAGAYNLGGVCLPDGTLLAVGGLNGTSQTRVESLNLVDYSVSIAQSAVNNGGFVTLSVEAEFANLAINEYDVYAYWLSPDGVSMGYDVYWIRAPGEVEFAIPVPMNAEPGMYQLIVEYIYVYDTDTWYSVLLEESLQFAVEVLDVPTIEEQIAALEEQLAALQETFDATNATQSDQMAALADAIAALQQQLAAQDDMIDTLEDKADSANLWAMLTMVLVVVVLVLLLLMFLMGRKKA